MRSSIILFAIFFFAISITAQRELGVRPTETGGPLKFEEAVYDVTKYDVTLNVDPTTKSIQGRTIVIATTVIPTNVMLLDLDTPYSVKRVTDMDDHDLKFERGSTAIRIFFPFTKQTHETIAVIIYYAGVPREAPRPPWVGGFMWAKTPSGADWISVALQNDGADLLFPCKDHPSDKPRNAEMHITVPDPLIATGPGKLQRVQKNNNGTSTFDWLMTNPIANYSIVFNAAPYKTVEDSYKSIAGDTMPIVFYVLPEDADKAPKLIAEQKKYLAFYEKYLGPYPFRSQKVGIVETPHLGMEHSTDIAYGNQFRFAEDGTDWLLLHEFGHEWWANLVTASDWKDFWIHEGFQSYMDTLYQEYLHGQDAYLKAMNARVKGLKNIQPVAPREAKIAYQVYMDAPDYINSDGDIYGKGALFLHTLRYLIGDKAFFNALHHMAYPTKEMETYTDGRQERLVTTDDFLTIAEQDSGMKLDWLFEVYLRQPKLPRLSASMPIDCLSTDNTCKLDLKWETPNGLPFPMPIDIEFGGKSHRVAMPNGSGSVAIPVNSKYVIDPKGWVLKAQ